MVIERFAKTGDTFLCTLLLDFNNAIAHARAGRGSVSTRFVDT
jgi:hypothetical protein